MDETSNLLLPYILAAQAQKHVTHNEALRRLDALVQMSVVDRDLSAPPASPAEGARYIVAASPTGAWAGHAGKVAAWQDGAWAIYVPRKGWRAWVEDEGASVAWDGAAWTAFGGATTTLNPATGGLVGVNATADTTNRLSVSSPASLFNHAGNGHQVKINKNAAADTGTILFQTGFSGRAEMGLAGSDDYSFKVSPDGSAWFSAMTINRATGACAFQNTPLSQFALTTSAQLRGVLSDETGAGAAVFADQPTLNNPVLGAGSSSQPALKLTSGGLKTAPAAGDVEFDGTSVFLTTDADNRGVVPAYHYIYQSSNYALTNTAVAQKMFSAGNGALALEPGLYFFELAGYMNGMSATSGNAAFDILGAGTAVLGTVLYHIVGSDLSNNTAGAQGGSINTAAQTPASMVTAATSTGLGFSGRGSFRITTAGTVIPSITLALASAATLFAGSYFRCWRAAGASPGTVGQWS